ncbi:hypothetical protein [Pseudopelagicola sp. nBUS_19]|uniref:hypothetical protein n=1 Tax=Pseudopelagicola sp. nBUS_19 TaxID=3395316 RepID=UPI003EBF13AA
MADNFLYGMSRQLNNKLSSNLDEWKVYGRAQQARVKELEQEVDNLDQEVLDYRFSADKRKSHQSASDAQIKYLMKLLDDVHGKENNPARMHAFNDDGKFRIPSGNRKGQRPNIADHVYITKFKENFDKLYAKKWGRECKNWIEFLHTRISY